jgi:catechol-2,3-dioxygenase
MSKVTSPSKLAHIVLRTTQFAPMVSFYKTFLGGHTTHENDFISFITYDDEHHRIAILAAPSTTPKVPGSAGLEHIAFAFDSLDDLAKAYTERKAHGINPLWSVNHGPTTSIYYQDPDGNQIETQVDNFDSVEEAGRFMESKEFAENPIGTDFDPEELIRRLKAGEDHASIKKRIEIGPRGLPTGM